MKSINKLKKINKDKAEVKVEFAAKNITPYGGLGLFRKFSRKIGVEKVLDQINPPQTEEISKGRYSVGKKILSLVYGLGCGLERPSDTEVLQKDKVVSAGGGLSAMRNIRTRPLSAVFSNLSLLAELMISEIRVSRCCLR